MEQEKKYLKTIEEVSDALAAGKMLYDNNGTIYTNFSQRNSRPV